MMDPERRQLRSLMDKKSSDMVRDLRALLDEGYQKNMSHEGSLPGVEFKHPSAGIYNSISLRLDDYENTFPRENPQLRPPKA